MKSLLLWLTPFLFLPVFAQKADVKWGSAINSETFVYDFLAESDGKFFTLSGRKDDLYLERYSSTNFTQDYSKELEVPELNGKKQDLEMICFLKDRFLLFTSLYDKKANLFTVSAYNVSREGMIAAKPKEILTLPAQSRNEGGEVEFVVAGDSTNILVVHRAYLKKEKK
ncbi:MAG TPA: hypothetical protein VI731_05300, partial [Bacteroidia bacterium]|nr:hypothetical protein [Bacteroidia bacterium]